MAETPWDEPVLPGPEAPDEDGAVLHTTDWPRPEVYARPATPDETPAVAASLAKLARSNGWAVRLTYSRGTVPAAKNRWTPSHVVDCIVLRAWRGRMGVVVSWERKDGKDYTTKSGWVLVPGVGPQAVNTIVTRAVLKAKP